jgi:hypothetical protein
MPEKTENSTGIKTLTIEAWKALGTKLYGPDFKKWRFKCVKCGNVQTFENFVALGMSQEEAVNVFFFSCIGRWKKDTGCDWTLGGLFSIHKLEVINEHGRPAMVFEFADELPV